LDAVNTEYGKLLGKMEARVWAIEVKHQHQSYYIKMLVILTLILAYIFCEIKSLYFKAKKPARNAQRSEETQYDLQEFRFDKFLYSKCVKYQFISMSFLFAVLIFAFPFEDSNFKTLLIFYNLSLVIFLVVMIRRIPRSLDLNILHCKIILSPAIMLLVMNISLALVYKIMQKFPELLDDYGDFTLNSCILFFACSIMAIYYYLAYNDAIRTRILYPKMAWVVIVLICLLFIGQCAALVWYEISYSSYTHQQSVLLITPERRQHLQMIAGWYFRTFPCMLVLSYCLNFNSGKFFPFL
jgi:hypothetical protein